MLCAELEPKILDYQENQLPPLEKAAVATHLAACPACASFARELQRLDRALSVQMQAPVLSADFDLHLQERIRALSGPISAAACAERKRQLQAEFEAGLARVRRGSFAAANVLNHLLWPAAATLAGWFAWAITAPLAAALNTHDWMGPSPNGTRLLMASAVFVTVVLSERYSRHGKILGTW